MARKTKIQLLTKTTANSGDTALSNVDLDLGEPLVDNTSTGKKVIIGGTPHTGDQTNKANSTGNITLGDSYNVVTNSSTGTENTGTPDSTDEVYINHIDNTVRSSHKIKGADANINVTASDPSVIQIGLNPNPKITTIGVGSTNATTSPVSLEYDIGLNALKFVFS